MARAERIRYIIQRTKDDTQSLGRKIASEPFSIFAYLINKTLLVLKWLILVGLFFGVLLFFVFVWRAGCFNFLPFGQSSDEGICGALLTSLLAKVQQTQVGTVTVKGGENILTLIFNPNEYFIKTFGTGDTIQNRDMKEYGVKIQRFRSVANNYFPGDPIELIADVEVVSPPDKVTTVNFECRFSNPNKIGRISGLPSTSNSVDVYEGQQTSFQFLCSFPEGIDIEDKMLVTKKVDLIASYTTSTESNLPIYTMSRDILDRLRKQGKNPLENIRDPLVDLNGKATSVYTPGPIKLGITSAYNQPFTNDISYLVSVFISNKIISEGSLEHLNFVQLILPESMILETDQSCDFEPTNSDFQRENNFAHRQYDVKIEELDNVNIPCVKILYGEKESIFNFIPSGISTYAECVDKYKTNLDFICKFKVINVPQSTTPQKDFITAVADYSYILTKPTTVQIISR